MKTFFVLCIALLTTTALSAQTFSIEGQITGTKERSIYLSYKGGRDSSKIENGQFHLKGNIQEPGKAILHFLPYPIAAEYQVTREFMLEPGNLRITVKGKNLRGAPITGSVSQTESESLDSMRVRVERETNLLSAKYDQAEAAYEAAVNEHVQDSLKAIVSLIHDQLSAYDNKIQQLTLHFIATHPDSYISALQLRSFIQLLPLDTLQQLYHGLSPRIRETVPGKEIAAEIRLIVAASPGYEAIDFKTLDINHKSLQLSSFRGKVVLLDFWASWCVPCRVANPHLIALFNKYNSKGFTIIGIADDEKAPAAWHKAIEKDKVGIWHHVLRGDLNHQFAIYSLPTKILIDKNGVIAGRYGDADGAALDKKLEEIL